MQIINTNFLSDLISRRAFIIGSSKIGLLSVLVMRNFYLQCIQRDKYSLLSNRNSTSVIMVAPDRGEIYDVNNLLIASNQTSFTLIFNKNNSDYIKEVEYLSELLEFDDVQKERMISKIKKSNKFSTSIIMKNIDWQLLSLIEENNAKLKSFTIDTKDIRYYHYADSMSHLLGYLYNSRINYNNSVTCDVKTGATGVEKYYNNLLNGVSGYKIVEMDSIGSTVSTIKQVNSISGNNLHLNIDSELQRKIIDLLPTKGCSVIVMDCTDGNVLSLVSLPGYDPNQLAKLSYNYWNQLVNDAYEPLINKVVQGNYPPGSIFKIITFLAALEKGVDINYTVNCTGHNYLGTKDFRCARKFGHGNINMIQAIQYSCNSYMYQLSRLIGVDPIIEMANKFGLGQNTGIDLPNEKSGFVPSRKWKKDNFGSGWSIGDNFNLSIGQGYLLVTPIQLVRLIAAVASDGKLFKPNVAKRESEFEQISISPKYLSILKKALHMAVNNFGGTAYYSRINNQSVQMSGKTGTAQVFAKQSDNDDLSKRHIAWNRRNHSIFVGYAPSSYPKYALSVYCNHGGSGPMMAAPIAKNIMQLVINKYKHLVNTNDR
ncbi:penicillin-binding protein 2 [Rickettsia endosymbiont of Cardiosporidium cionae]|uniref:penicillin-binding protein 2 n=1 Tax=Rickettsia endosymbiont of Cardiosporidium cionae TaxID=2777155 RepID=UPI001E28ABC2|nr:penicillin-binding protein 2 [Rickettsia endosymbiont of Cardiosporidium cionae]KAF8818330.1 penicillin-binding protein 2 [Rickettsia endosymbiont of Cardiosporidium cionae]